MPYFLVQVAYTPQAWAALVKNPQDRIKSIAPAVEGLGGRVQDGYLAFGDYDVVAICEFPDNVSAASFAVSVSAGGAVKSFRTTPLLTPDEGVAVMEKAASSSYIPPT